MLSDGVEFGEATEGQVLAEMENWWKIEKFQKAAKSIIAREMKIIMDKYSAEAEVKNRNRRAAGAAKREPAPSAFEVSRMVKDI